MRVLILGGSGMLGHKLVQCFQERFDTFVTLRNRPTGTAITELFASKQVIIPVAVEDFDSIVKAMAHVRPDVVINCIGIVKQDAAGKDPLRSIPVNSLFPHRLAQLCRVRGARLVHLSTDCVFSGRKGNYSEADTPDAEDLYGRTKLLGEVAAENCLTLRTSIVGRELAGTSGLLEWFLSQKGNTVHGYKRAIFSGFTTNALAEVIAWLIEEHPRLFGVWHVAAPPTSKYGLLNLVKKVYCLSITVEPDETFVCDRSLDGSRFAEATGFEAPDWDTMIKQMYEDQTPYPVLRGENTC